jgi:hypothetical protein
MKTDQTSLTPVELKHWLDQEKAFHLINVMTPECHECSRNEGSMQACVYETAFLDPCAGDHQGQPSCLRAS